MHASPRLLDFLKLWEKFEPHLYPDAGGHCSIGWGHLVHLGPPGQDVSAELPFRDGITPSAAETLLRRDIARAEWAVANLVAVKLTQNQFDVLTSFVFNVGAGAFGESTLRRLLNDRMYDAVPHELARWHYARKTSSLGLVRRRAAEAAWWLEA